MEYLPIEIIKLIFDATSKSTSLAFSSTCTAYRPLKPSSLTDDQLNALTKVSEGKNIYIIGSAGTGKSYCIERMMKKFKDKAIVTSTTGFSSSLLGCVTIDSFVMTLNRSKVPPTFVILIIDEASMLGENKIKKLDISLRRRYNNLKVFGGKQLVLVGDPLQLPPVLDNILFYSAYYTMFELNLVRLLQIVRQKDAEFAGALNMIRLGVVNEKVNALMSEMENNIVVDPIIVVATNEESRSINLSNLDRIQADVVEYVRTVEFNGGNVAEISTRLEEVLRLKVGCKVMIIKNISVKDGLTNGTRGEVIGFNDGLPIVGIGDGENFRAVVIDLYEETNVYRNDVKVDYDSIDDLLEGASVDVLRGYSIVEVKVTQIPLTLCWATTVHKMQGCTVDGIFIDCKKIFFDGQLYTALSRATKKEGIMLANYSSKCIRANFKLVNQLNKLRYGVQVIVNPRDPAYDGFLSAQEPYTLDWI